MEPAAWERLCEVVADALERAPVERAAHVERALADDAQLAAEALRLLAHEARAERLEPLPAATRSIGPSAGQRIGPWTIEAPLGRGGMGSVYRVRREADGLRAALKLLHVGLALSPAGVRRFESERRLLARLDHPGIARSIDGGLTEEELPYLVLEYVEGRALDRYVREEALDVRARVRLFRSVCAAVAYAHQHLIVHRDLKPANVLVDAEGRARLLDFGIAKLLDRDEDGDDLTRAGERPMTPRYASPEQVRGEPLTTASDVYSLGVVLYELLAGVSPYAQADTGAELERAVRDATPSAPSTALGRASEGRAGVDLRRLRRQVAGDLDRIVLRALAKEPGRRYASAAELDDDLGRWLDRLPVRARPDGAFYRLGRFASRNRALVAAVATLVVSLSVGFVVAAREARLARAAEHREADARDRSERHFDQARALIDDLVFGVHDRIERLTGATPARRYVLERAHEHLAALGAEPDLRERLGEELAATWMRLAEVQGARTVGSEGDVEGALESTWQARELLAVALERAPADLGRIDALCDAERQLGDLARQSGRPDEALESYGRVEELAARGLALDGTHAGLHRQRALAAGQRGLVLLEQSRAEAAVEQLELARSLLSEREPLPELERDLTLVELRLARGLAEGGAYERSLELRRTACERARRLAAADPLDAQLALDAVAAGVAVAEGLRHLSRLAEAEAELDLAVEELRGMLASDPTNQLPRRHLIEALEAQGAIALELGVADRALERFGQAVELAEARLASSRGDASALTELARLGTVLGDTLWAAGERDEAAFHFERALERLVDAGDGVEARRVRFAAEIGLADVATHLGRSQESSDLLEELLERAARDRAACPEAPWPLRNRALAGWRLATLLEAWGGEASREPAQRIELLTRARTLYAEGRDLAEQMAARGWLTPLEQRKDVRALFEADVERLDGSLAALGAEPGA